MKITFDDQYLITVSEDAVLMIWKISDKEGRALAKRDKEVGYAEEILITKSDLEEKVGDNGSEITVLIKWCCSYDYQMWTLHICLKIIAVLPYVKKVAIIGLSLTRKMICHFRVLCDVLTSLIPFCSYFQNTVMAELKQRVEELKMENEYQLRLKDMNYNEKIKELTEKFIQEMESLKTKNQVLKTEKDKQEAKHDEELAEMMEKQSKELQELGKVLQLLTP